MKHFFRIICLLSFSSPPSIHAMNEAILDAAKIINEREMLWIGRKLNPEFEWVYREIELDVDLYEAIGRGNIDQAKKLLEAGASCTKRSKKLYSPTTPLIRSIKSSVNCVEMCKLLLDYGAEIDDQENGWTALMYAAVTTQVQVCQLLLNKGAHILARSFENNTALLLVAIRRASIISLLKNASENDQDPLYIDLIMNIEKVGEVLVAHQRQQEKKMIIWLACLKWSENFAIREIYRQRNALLIPHLNQYLVKTLLEAKNDEGKSVHGLWSCS